jgi:HEAT repeat protein
MAAIYHIFRRALAMKDAAVDRAMAGALPTADARSVQLIGLSLLQRHRPAGLAALIEHYHRLPGRVQREVAARAEELARPLREATGRGAEAASNALAVVEQSQAMKLAYLAAGVLRHGPVEAHPRAGACLQAMADGAASDPRPGRPPASDPAISRFLAEAVEEAVVHYGAHRQPPVLLAWLALLPRPLAASTRTLAKGNHPALGELRSMLEAAESARAVRALPLLATVPTLTASAQRGLATAAKSAGLGPALTGCHLLAWRPVWRAVRSMRQPARFWPEPSERQALAGHEARGLAAWAEALAFDADQQIERWSALSEFEEPTARLGGLRRLVRLADDAASRPESPQPETVRAAQQAIARFCHDPEPPLARMALNYLLRRDYADRARLLGELLNSPHDSVRRIASRQFAPLGFARLWESWPQMEPARRQAAAQALIKIDAQFDQALARKLDARSHDARLRALSMIAELNRGSQFEPKLTELTRARDEVIASAAVKALGSAGSEQAATELAQVLDHRDSRVRANAVEALSEVESTRHVQKLATMAQTEANRPRANAIQSLMQMQAGDAMTALTRMLSDDRAEHRISALWVVETMGVVEVARQVAELAGSDPAADVRSRAAQTARNLLTDWRHDQPPRDAAG